MVCVVERQEVRGQGPQPLGEYDLARVHTPRGAACLERPQSQIYFYKAIFSIVTGCEVNSEGQGQLAAALH
jgi:hypothetical protein